MTLSVYISNSRIMAVTGNYGKRASIKKTYMMPLPDGVIVSGAINNPTEFRKSLAEFWNTNKLPRKDVHIIFNSNKIVARTEQISFLTEKTAANIINQKMQTFLWAQDNHSLNDYLILDLGKTQLTLDLALRKQQSTEYKAICKQAKKDKEPIPKREPFTRLAPAVTNGAPGDLMNVFNGFNRTSTVLISNVDKTLVDSLADAMQDLNIKVKSIDTALNSLVRLTTNIPELKTSGKNSALLFLDGNMLVSVLLANGKYRYSTYTKISSENGTISFAQEVARIVDNLRQILNADRDIGILQKAYMCGFDETDMEYCSSMIGNIGVATDYIPIPKGLTYAKDIDIRYWMIVASSLIHVASKHQSNFLIATNRPKNDHTRAKTAAQSAKPIILSLIAVLILGGAIFTINSNKKSELSELQSYLASPDVIAKVAEYERLSSISREYTNIVEGTKRTILVEESYPKITSDIISQIRNLSGEGITISISGYTANTGELKFRAMSEKVINIPDYIKILKDSKLFYNVSYSGYRFNDTETEIYKGGYYSINLKCNLLAGNNSIKAKEVK